MLVALLITFLVIVLVLYLINLLPLDPQAMTIARAIVIVVGIVALLRFI